MINVWTSRGNRPIVQAFKRSFVKESYTLIFCSIPLLKQPYFYQIIQGTSDSIKFISILDSLFLNPIISYSCCFFFK